MEGRHWEAVPSCAATFVRLLEEEKLAPTPQKGCRISGYPRSCKVSLAPGAWIWEKLGESRRKKGPRKAKFRLYWGLT